MKSIKELLFEVKAIFQKNGIETPDLDASLLIQHILQKTKEELFLNQNDLIGEVKVKDIEKCMARRLQGEPVSRITGMRGFWKYNFKISRETLDPRADSEALIEAALKHVVSPPQKVLDLGTGSGCLLISLLKEWPGAKGVGVDISFDATETATENAKRLDVSDRIYFIENNWISLPDDTYDVIISNPPYIPDAEIQTLAPEVAKHDPYRALAGGEDGLDCYRSLAKIIPRLLADQGWVFLEIGATQAVAVKEILADAGMCVVETASDLAGYDRCIVARKTQWAGSLAKQLPKFGISR